jgi:G3E family GTPase
MDPILWREAPLETVLCVVDATAQAALRDDALFQAQIRAADLIALSKADLADTAGIRIAVAAIKPAATIVEATQGHLPTALLFPADPDRLTRDPGPRRPTADRFETLTWTSDHPLSLPRLQTAIGQLSPKLARAKGLFETIEEPGRQMLLQLAGGRATLSPTNPRPAGAPRARLVFIAELGTLSPREIDAAMDECTVV